MSLIIYAYIFFIISIPLIFKKIKPNYFYGFKTKKTLENKEIWYKANKFLGITLYITAIIILLSSMFLYFFLNKIEKNLFQIMYLIIFLGPLLSSIIISSIYVYQLKPEPTNKKQSKNFIKKLEENKKNKVKPIFFLSAIIAIIFIIISIPLILEKIQPNNYYGFRTKKTFQSEEIWYKANKFSGIALFISSLVTLFSSIISLIYLKKISIVKSFLIFHLICWIPLSISILISFLYIYNL